MKDLTSLQKYYNSVEIHKDCCFCHSMDKKRYKILCERFFAEKENQKLFVKLAEETVELSNESEKLFLQWLNVEWYD